MSKSFQSFKLFRFIHKPLHFRAQRCLSAKNPFSLPYFLKRKNHNENGKETYQTKHRVTQHGLRDEEAGRERFIAITRHSVIRHLLTEPDLLTEQERAEFEQFAMSLDAVIVNRYHGLLQELKSLFDPINPDKDTISTRHWTRRERLDNEFWLLQKLGNVMEKANFCQLSTSTVQKALSEKSASEGVLVSVNTDKYDILRFYALGKEMREVNLTWQEKLKLILTLQSVPKPDEYYKRVVVAVRLKRDDKLILKGFKEVPVNDLEKLLPDGKIKMSPLDLTILSTTIGFVATGITAKFLSNLAQVYLDWSVIIAAVVGFTALRTWSSYNHRKNAYLVNLTRTLYFKNIANNRSLLTVLVDRAEDELFKEALLTYTFLLTNRPPGGSTETDTNRPPEQGMLEGMSEESLKRKIEEWVEQKTDHKIEFRTMSAVQLLQEVGLVSMDTNHLLRVLPLEASRRVLPASPPLGVLEKQAEWELAEGYDRTSEDRAQEGFYREELVRAKYGWF